MEEVKIIESSQIPLGEKVYLKKDFLGWRVVEPIIDPETGKFVWKNFFSKKGFFNLAILLLILAIGYLAFKETLANMELVLQNPCAFCNSCQEQVRQMLNTLPRNLQSSPSLNFTI